MRWSVEYSVFRGHPVMHVHGELDAASCPELESRLVQLAQTPRRCVILDLLDLSYSEAAPLGAVLAAHHQIADAGKLLAVVCCTPFMDRLMELAGARSRLRMYDSLEEAVANLPDDC